MFNSQIKCEKEFFKIRKEVFKYVNKMDISLKKNNINIILFAMPTTHLALLKEYRHLDNNFILENNTLLYKYSEGLISFYDGELENA